MTEQSAHPASAINPQTGMPFTSPLPDRRPTGMVVEALHEDMTGTWMVWTIGSTHLWDFRPDGVYWTRIPGAGRSQFVGDADAQRLTRVEQWPVIGGVHFLWFDDPSRPWDIEQWRQSSTVRHIERVETVEPVESAEVVAD